MCLKPVLIRGVLMALISASFLSQPAIGEPDAREITYVTIDPYGTDYGPQFSPDSRRLIFERRPLTGGRAETYVVPIQGGEPKPFLKERAPVEQTRLRWSPVTNTIAFTGLTSEGKSSTWLLDGDGTHVRQANAPPGANTFYPSWYGDGLRLLEMDGDRQALRIVSLGPGAATQVATTPALLTGMGSVSPDGRTIAVAAQRNVGQTYDQTVNQIWLIAENGEAHPLEKGNMEGRAPTWSPDGSRVVFESNRSSPDKASYAVFVADRDGSDVRRLTPYEANAQHPVWSPDGRWIAFSARQAKAGGTFGGRFGPAIAIITAPSPGPRPP
jgi:Tol biopolymer transport system component